MDYIEDFNIKKSRGQYVLYNRKSTKGAHTHIKTKRTCHMLVDWVCNKIIPKSNYLKVSAMRISRDEKYIEMVKDNM